MHHWYERHILDQHSIYPYPIELSEQESYSLQFRVIDDGVDRDKHLCAETMSVVAERSDVVDAVAHRRTCAKVVGTDIHGVGTMVDGSNATFEITGRSQQFN